MQIGKHYCVKLFFPLIGSALLLFRLEPLGSLDCSTLTTHDVEKMSSAVLQTHLSQQTIAPELVKNLLTNYFDDLDKGKSYFLKSEVESWLSPDCILNITKAIKLGQFDQFTQILQLYNHAICRRRELLSRAKPPPNSVVSMDSLMPCANWAISCEELLDRLQSERACLLKSLEHLPTNQRAAVLDRLKSRQARAEDQFLELGPERQAQYARTLFLKALGASLDAHTCYLTPFQLEQLSIGIQQRFKGVGLHLCEQVDGFSILKIIEGSPAERCEKLFPGDLITAIDGEPVAGLELADVSRLIRGPEGTQTLLTIFRKGELRGQSLIVPVTRESILVKEGRVETSVHPFGEDSIGVIKLNSFYEDEDTCSAQDLADSLRQLQNAKSNSSLAALVLDLRENSGGLLPQAVEVVGLFIKRGVVVSIKDSDGKVHHVRNLNSTPCWEGPLVILTSRASASASEIVAQSLQDFGRAILVGDDRTYGKGTFQTLCLSHKEINPKGDFKVTRGRYYTPSGKSPQKIGVRPDILVPGPLSSLCVGEEFAKCCIETDQIASTYHFPLDDLPLAKREIMRRLYSLNLQEREQIYGAYVPLLRKNSEGRMLASKSYQSYLAFLQKSGDKPPLQEMLQDNEQIHSLYELMDLQLNETLNIAKDLILVHRHRRVIAHR